MALTLAVQEIFRASLPHHPYCSDDKTASLIRNREHALQHQYIQPNLPQSFRWLLFDIDREDAALTWHDRDLPPPTWIATDPETGKGHIAYGLKTPVFRLGKSRSGPLRYLGAIENAYSARLGSDPHYVGLMAKNPEHSRWRVWCPANDPVYELGYLAEYVDLRKHQEPRVRQSQPPDVLWRNDILFDDLRLWACVAIRLYWTSPYSDWLNAVLFKARDLNVFPLPKGPLPFNEIRNIAKSVAKWTWKNVTQESFDHFVARTHLPEIQAERGRLSGIARREQRAAARLRASDLRLAGKNTYEIAAELGVDQSTISRWLRA